MSAHSKPWTPGRILADRFIGRTYPGKHHPLWSEPARTKLAIVYPSGPRPRTSCIVCEEHFGITAARMFGGKQ